MTQNNSTNKLSACDIQEMIVSSFVDASDYLNFMRAGVDAQEWARTNEVEIERDLEFDEAIARIQHDFRMAALARMEADIQEVEFDEDGTRLPLFHSATRDEIAAMAEKNYDEAREEIEANGTLF